MLAFPELPTEDFLKVAVLTFLKVANRVQMAAAIQRECKSLYHKAETTPKDNLKALGSSQEVLKESLKEQGIPKVPKVPKVLHFSLVVPRDPCTLKEDLKVPTIPKADQAVRKAAQDHRDSLQMVLQEVQSVVKDHTILRKDFQISPLRDRQGPWSESQKVQEVPATRHREVRKASN